MKTAKKAKTIPALKTDEAAEDFVARADLAQYDLSGFAPPHRPAPLLTGEPPHHHRPAGAWMSYCALDKSNTKTSIKPFSFSGNFSSILHLSSSALVMP